MSGIVLNQCYEKLNVTLLRPKLNGRHNEFVIVYEIQVSELTPAHVSNIKLYKISIYHMSLSLDTTQCSMWSGLHSQTNKMLKVALNTYCLFY
jgi:hypothetical protein